MPRTHRAVAGAAFLACALALTPLARPATTASAVELSGDAGHLVRTPAPAASSPSEPNRATAAVQAQRQRPAVVANVAGVELRSPTHAVAVAGFHEGSTRSLALEPADAAHDHGPQAPVLREGTPPVVVMPSRGRPAPATSAVDLAVAADTPLVSPVTGTVVGVSQYALYGNVTDWLVEVRPDAAPDLVVRIFHVVDPSVAMGQRLEAGATPFAAAARLLPFPSQVDGWTTTPLPHVHVQVDRA